MIWLVYYIFGKTVGRWLFLYVFNAGNMIATLLALVTPYFVRNYILPHLYHPYRYGGIPFMPPGFFEFQLLYYIFIMGLLTCYYLMSAYLNIYKFCDKSPVESSPTIFYNITKFLLVMLICFLILIFVPFKLWVAAGLIFIPHANELINGIVWCLFTLFGVSWANIDNVLNICDINPYTDI